MGLKPVEVKSLTLVEFLMMIRGHQRRKEQQWDYTRNIMTTIINTAGRVTSRTYRPAEVFPLDLDKQGIKRFITTRYQALELLKEFE